MSHTLYELAINQHCQDRLRQEITEQLEKTNGQITYNSIKEMKYLNQVYHGNENFCTVLTHYLTAVL